MREETHVDASDKEKIAQLKRDGWFEIGAIPSAGKLWVVLHREKAQPAQGGEA